MPLALALGGCVSKSTANAKAREAFVAGQQRAMENMRQMQAQGPTVTFTGPVRNVLIPWTADLTLAKAVLAADYFGKSDPSAITIHRGGEEIRVDPKKLLAGDDIPLQPRDIIDIVP